MPTRPDETEDQRQARMVQEAYDAFWARNAQARQFLSEYLSMPHISQMFQSRWITRADVETPVVATIRACTPEQMRGRDGGGPETRWILWFHEAKKGLKLNSTNIKTLAEGFGDHTEQWIGQRVRLYVDPNVQMAGQTVGGVRIQCPRSAHPAAFTQPTPQGAFAGQPMQPVNNGAFGAQPNSRPGAFTTSAAGAKPPLDPAFDPSYDPATGVLHDQAGRRPGVGGNVDSEFDDDIPF